MSELGPDLLKPTNVIIASGFVAGQQSPHFLTIIRPIPRTGLAEHEVDGNIFKKRRTRFISQMVDDAPLWTRDQILALLEGGPHFFAAKIYAINIPGFNLEGKLDADSNTLETRLGTFIGDLTGKLEEIGWKKTEEYSFPSYATYDVESQEKGVFAAVEYGILDGALHMGLTVAAPKRETAVELRDLARNELDPLVNEYQLRSFEPGKPAFFTVQRPDLIKEFGQPKQ